MKKKNSMKKEEIISVVVAIATGLSMLAILYTVILSGCGGGENHTCMKCGGSGKVRDKYGYSAYVTCPRCHGVGYLTY